MIYTAKKILEECDTRVRHESWGSYRNHNVNRVNRGESEVSSTVS